jgi:hypothetical protein
MFERSRGGFCLARRRDSLRAPQFVSSLIAAFLISSFSIAQAETGNDAPTGAQAFELGFTGASYCSEANPSCGRDPWWLQYNELQSSELVSFGGTSTPLTVESRYLEALHVLGTWEEGEALLGEGSKFGVSIMSGLFAREPTAIASYNSARRSIQVNPRYAQAATWMLAAVLSHELQHIADSHNRLYQLHASEDCLTRETRAYETESRFITWYTRTLVGETLPVQELREQSLAEHRGLSDLLIRINSAPDVSELVRKDYAELCARNP